MLKLIIIGLCIAINVSIAFASSYSVIDLPAPNLRTSDKLKTKFLVNLSTGEGSVQFEAIRSSTVRGSRGQSHTRYDKILEIIEPVAGLQLEGDKVIYLTPEGSAIECGTMRESRIFKIPTLYLSGKCNLEAKLVYNNEVKQIQVKLIID